MGGGQQQWCCEKFAHLQHSLSRHTVLSEKPTRLHLWPDAPSFWSWKLQVFPPQTPVWSLVHSCRHNYHHWWWYGTWSMGHLRILTEILTDTGPNTLFALGIHGIVRSCGPGKQFYSYWTQVRASLSWHVVRRSQQNKHKITEEVLVAALHFFYLHVAATTKSMSTRQRQKGSADMKESKFLPEYDLYSFVVEQNEKSLPLKCCCESVISTVKQDNWKHCSVHTWERACTVPMLSKHCHKFWAAYGCPQRGLVRTFVDMGGCRFLRHTYQSGLLWTRRCGRYKFYYGGASAWGPRNRKCTRISAHKNACKSGADVLNPEPLVEHVAMIKHDFTSDVTTLKCPS